MAENTKKKGFFTGIGEFFKGLKTELKKIAWPTKEKTAKQTLAVVIISVLLGLFISGIDFAGLKAVEFLSNLIK